MSKFCIFKVSLYHLSQTCLILDIIIEQPPLNLIPSLHLSSFTTWIIIKNNNRNICNESTIIDVDTHIYSHIYTRQWIWANVSLFTHSITIFFCHRWFSSSSPRSFSLFFPSTFFLRLVSATVGKKLLLFFYVCEKNYYFFFFPDIKRRWRWIMWRLK